MVKSFSFVFRADASVQMGNGHFMRCLTLAEYLKKRGAKITFISRLHEGNLFEHISKKDIEIIALPKPEVFAHASSNTERDNHAEWLGVSQENDAKETIKALGDDQPDWLVVDHYGLDEVWEKAVRSYVKNIMVIDDLANRSHCCDMLLDQNRFENMETRYDALVHAGCTRLIGPKYALLRTEFTEGSRFLLIDQSKKTCELVDRFGCQTVVEWLLGDLSKQHWKVHNTSEKQMELYWIWANDKLVRKNAFNKEPITWDNHVEWFRGRLANKKCSLYLILVNKKPVGQVRFDDEDMFSRIDYSIAKQFRGRKLGKKLLGLAIKEFQKHSKQKILGEVIIDNIASSKIFESLGFAKEISRGNIIYTKKAKTIA